MVSANLQRFASLPGRRASPKCLRPTKASTVIVVVTQMMLREAEGMVDTE